MKDHLEKVFISALQRVEGLEGRICPLQDIGNEHGPLIVFNQTGCTADTSLEGRTGLRSAEYAVYVLHNSYEDMRALAEQVAECCYALQGARESGVWVEYVTMALNTPDLDEFRVNLFRRTYTVRLDYQIYEGE